MMKRHENNDYDENKKEMKKTAADAASEEHDENFANYCIQQRYDEHDKRDANYQKIKKCNEI